MTRFFSRKRARFVFDLRVLSYVTLRQLAKKVSLRRSSCVTSATCALLNISKSFPRLLPGIRENKTWIGAKRQQSQPAIVAV